MTPGGLAWLVLLGAALALAGLSRLLEPLAGARPAAVVATLLSHRASRLVLAALWAEAGYHLFCQRP